MNRKMICNMVGRIVLLEAALMLIPLIVSITYGEKCVTSFILTILFAVVIGAALVAASRMRDSTIFAKEGFVIVAFAWLVLSAIGALPFVISGEIPHYVDAFFETVSGFTTTGATILTDIEAMSKGLLFWRSFTHWMGGMGVLVLVMAIIPSESGRAIHIMRAEVPGPIVGKIVPRIRETAKTLYLMYMALTVAEVIFLLCGGMSLYESMIHTFGSAGTGGFSCRADSIASYSPYLQWVITVFMLMFGVNFNVYFLIMVRNFKAVLKSGELWCYLGIAVVSGGIITLNILPRYTTFGEALRHGYFQMSSIMTTTGFTTADFNQWPTLSKAILLMLMFSGACAGSTGGGLKVSRVMLLFKQIRREIQSLLHPRSVGTIRLEGKRVDSRTLTSVSNYFALYIVCFVAMFLILCLEPYDIETNFSAVAACFNNIGPGLAAVGPVESYAGYSVLSKIVLSVGMLLGRLEIYPLLLAIPSIIKPNLLRSRK